MNLHQSAKVWFALFLIGGTTLKAQLAFNNNGSLTLQINNGLTVHSDGDVANMNTSTLVFESAGEPNLEFDGHFTYGVSATLTGKS